MGRDRGQRLTDGGGEWAVRNIEDLSEEEIAGSFIGDFRGCKEVRVRSATERRESGGRDVQKIMVPPSKMDFPPYDGSMNAVEWLQKCEDYFDDQGIYNDDAKVHQTMFVLTGKAYYWHNNLRRLITHRLSWREFKRICKSRFGRADTVNPIGELSNLRHIGTVDEYCEQFEECLGRQTRLTGDQQLWQFCAGLTNSFRKEVEYLRPETIFEAMEYARDNEYKIEGANGFKLSEDIQLKCPTI